MFNRSKLDDGGELTAHIEDGQLVLANLNGQGKTVWQKRMAVAEARDLRDFLDRQNLEDPRPSLAELERRARNSSATDPTWRQDYSR